MEIDDMFDDEEDIAQFNKQPFRGYSSPEQPDLEMSLLSWDGFNVTGDAKSIAKVKYLVETEELNDYLKLRIKKLEGQLTEAQASVVSGWFMDEVPSFRQGAPVHEMEEVITASDATAWISKIIELHSKITQLETEAELGKVAMKFVDRAADVHPGIDDAETICEEFSKAMAQVLDKYYEGE